MSLIKRKFKKVSGLDASIFFTVLTRIIQGAGGVFTLLLVTRFLDQNELGYYYTFGSIIAIQLFFELGLNSIITQYIAHEAAHLTWKSRTELVGEEYYRSRLASLLHFTTKWFLVISALLLAVLLIAGNIFFSSFHKDLNINWQNPWLILVIATCIILLVDSCFAILEGLGKVKEVARFRLFQQLIYLCCIAIFLSSGLKLYSGGLALLISGSLTGIFLSFSHYRIILIKIWQTPVTSKVAYRTEILPFQFKIATGYMSSYLIVSLINPVVFASQGTVLAGQIGATQTVLNGIMSASLSWISTKATLFSNLVARQKFRQLNLVFHKYVWIATTICISGLIIFFSLRQLLYQIYPPLDSRFLTFTPMLFLGLTQVANIIGYSQGYYLRSFKKEPFFVASIVIGILSGISTLVCSKYTGINGISIGYFIVNGLVGFTWGCLIFIRKKKEFTHRIYDFS